MRKSTPLSIRRYAYTVAGPCDYVINFAINASVAWLLFRSESSTPCFGPHSLSTVMVAIAGFCATFATFFGYFNAIRERRAGKVLPPCDPQKPWAKTAWRVALVRGLIAFAIASAISAALRPYFAEVEIPTLWAIGITGAYAGVLGYWIHTSAIIRAGTFNVLANSSEATT